MKTPGPSKDELRARLQGYSFGYSPTQSGSFALGDSPSYWQRVIKSKSPTTSLPSPRIAEKGE